MNAKTVYLRHFAFNSIVDFIGELVFSGCLVTLIYFLLINYRRVKNIKVLNNILFINYFMLIMLLLFNNLDLISFIIYRILLFSGIVIFLGLIFYSKNKKLLKPNILTVVCMILYVIYIVTEIYSLVNIYHVNDFKIVLQIILSTIYLVPMVLYFRLYAFNKLKKKEEN